MTGNLAFLVFGSIGLISVAKANVPLPVRITYGLLFIGILLTGLGSAKVLEQLDYPIFRAIGISGHTLKHLAAAVSTWYFVVLFRRGLSPYGGG